MQRSFRRGFTLVELMTVIFILALLVALLLGAVQGSREVARRTQCLQKMSEVAKGIDLYETAQGHYPGYRHFPFSAWEWTGKKHYSQEKQFTYSTGWFPAILEYIERRDLIDPMLPRSWKRPLRNGTKTFSWTPRLHQKLVCPSDAEKMALLQPLSSFVVNAGAIDAQIQPGDRYPADWRTNAMFLDQLPFRGNRNNKVTVTPKMDRSFIGNGDGLANTGMLSESIRMIQWFDQDEPTATFVFVEPSDATSWPTFPDPYAGSLPTSHHPTGVNAVFADGHGRLMSKHIDYLVYVALMTPKGSEAKQPGTNTAMNDYVRNPQKYVSIKY